MDCTVLSGGQLACTTVHRVRIQDDGNKIDFTLSLFSAHSEMQKVADAADISVLFFFQLVLIFGPFWVIFGPFWQFGVNFGPIRAILGNFWAILGNFR